MKRTGILLRERLSFSKCLPFALAAMAFVVTGCPHNQYIVELKPHGKRSSERWSFTARTA